MSAAVLQDMGEFHPSVSPTVPLFHPAAAPSAEQTVSPDQSLLSRVQAGDAQALATIYDTYSRLVYSVALRVLRDPAKAEDVLQDVFLKIWRSPESFCSGHGSLGAWLAVIARNRAIDTIRRLHAYEDVDDMQLEGTADVGGDVETGMLIDKVRHLLRQMPREQTDALEMAFFKGMTHTEIVASTGLPLGTVKTRIRAALLALGKSLRQARNPV